ncbi:MAG: hypothetical protein K2W95_16040 [Candidatus Obscuribacterales bacterium]|nr:hypothetical protein [Candidatus Obscuribacterales bacterium]
MLKPISALAAALILASSVCVSGAEAFGWGYNPATGSNFGYLARSVLYGSGLYRGGYGAPGYLVNSLVWNGAYAVGQGFNTARAKSAAKSFAQNAQPVGNGFMMSNGVVDQIAPAKWLPQGNQPVPAANAAPAPALPFNQPDMDPAFMPVPQGDGFDMAAAPILTPPATPGPVGAGGVPQSVASEFPPVAPDAAQSLSSPEKGKGKEKTKKIKERKSKPQAVAAALPATASTGKSPFAGALVDHINKNFDGDIGRALNDQETSKFARAIGLIQENQTAADVPADRVDLVRKILADPSDDPDLKVQTVRLLLKHQ